MPLLPKTLELAEKKTNITFHLSSQLSPAEYTVVVTVLHHCNERAALEHETLSELS